MNTLNNYIFEKLRINKSTKVADNPIDKEIDELCDIISNEIEKSQYKKYVLLIKLDRSNTSIIIELNNGIAERDAISICGFVRYQLENKFKYKGLTDNTAHFDKTNEDIIIDYSNIYK